MKIVLRESCSCGATLDYSEEVETLMQEMVKYRQDSFHEAHKKCRTKLEEEKI